jgi:hypothetical protein
MPPMSDREGFGDQIVERRSGGAEPLPELGGFGPQLVVGEALDLGFFGIDLGDERPDALQLAVVCRADNFRQEGVDNHSGRMP